MTAALHATGILWPDVSSARVDASDSAPGSEPALLEYASGRIVRGTLMRFSPEKECIEFLSQGDDLAHEIRFDELREVRLARSVRLDPAHRPLSSPREGMLIPRVAQPYRIEFVGGGKREGETLGWAKSPAGVFLLLPSYSEQVIRSAIQRRASTAELGALAVAAGMRTMKQDGIEKCLLGMTDLHEVRGGAS